jgi:tRNA pseudouridine38-40 synthase
VPEQRLRATVEYDGSDFHGFQLQAGGRTVQAVLEAALGRYTPAPRVIAAGRTDAGVHACGQVIHFAYSGRVPVARLAAVLNGQLPNDVAIRECREAPPGFHARYSALGRTYGYHLLQAEERLPLAERYAWRVAGALDVPAMAGAAASLPGTHSFRHFGSIPGSDEQRRRSQEARGWRRTVYRSELHQRANRLCVEIEADAFLTHMMRALVGALVAVGHGRIAPAELRAALGDESSDRAVAAIAPAHGLTLFRVRYPDEW